jgi:hypothetical protein
MELLNHKVFNNPNDKVSVSGEWINNKTPKWKGAALSESPMVSVSFLEIDNEINWVKSERSSMNIHEIEINIFNYDNIGLDIQYNYFFNHGFNYYRSQIKSKNYLPYIFTGDIEAGTIYLFSSLEGEPKLNLFILYIPSEITKISRNGIWHIKDNYKDTIDEKFINIFQNGRKGKMLI